MFCLPTEDECCCSLRDKAIFFACFTATHTAILFAHNPMELIKTIMGDNKLIKYVYLLKLLDLICHLHGTIFLFIGIYAETGLCFLLGIVFSSIYPYLNFYLVYLPIVQVVMTYYGIKYYKVLKEKDQD